MKKIIEVRDENGKVEDIVEVEVRPKGVTVPIKYFDKTLPELGRIGGKSDWIDLYSRRDMFVPEGTFAMVPLNVAMALPDGFEAHVVPRSSTFKNWGLIQTNHTGIIDGSYCGDTDEWMLPVYCMPGYGKHSACLDGDGEYHESETRLPGVTVKGTFIHKGDRLCQFRIEEHMPPVLFNSVEHLDSMSRGGFGTTGR